MPPVLRGSMAVRTRLGFRCHAVRPRRHVKPIKENCARLVVLCRVGGEIDPCAFPFLTVNLCDFKPCQCVREERRWMNLFSVGTTTRSGSRSDLSAPSASQRFQCGEGLLCLYNNASRLVPMLMFQACYTKMDSETRRGIGEIISHLRITMEETIGGLVVGGTKRCRKASKKRRK